MIVTRTPHLIARAVVATALGLAGACAVQRPPLNKSVQRIDAALIHGDTAAGVELLRSRVRTERCSPREYTRLAAILRSRGSVVDRFSAQRVLEQGLRKYPDNTDVLVDLGRTYYEQTFYGDAEKTFERVLSLEPDRCEAHYYLGANAYRKWKRVQSYTDYLAAAIDHLSRSRSCHARNADALHMIAFSQYVLGEPALAAETCSSTIALHADDPEPLMLLGTIAHESGRYEEAWRLFRRAMELSTEGERTKYTDIALLLTSGDERDRYEAPPAERRTIMQREYWLEHDPDPTTEINERWLEHACRVFLSDVRFASDTPRRRGWETERGKALIKFGLPDEVHTTLDGPRPHSGRTETWFYLAPAEAFVLGFEDEYLSGNYTVPIGDDFSAETLYRAPPVSALVSQAAPIPGALDVVTFRDTDTTASIYVAYAADDDSLEKILRTWDIESFVARTAFFDTESSARLYDADTVRIDSLPPNDPHRPRPGRWAKRFVLPFDSYRVSFCLEDARGLTRSLASGETNTLKYLGQSLALSDILLHSPVRQATSVAIDRGHNRYWVSNRGVFAPPEPLRLYVEIYNLVLSDRRSDYGVIYSILEADTAESGTRKFGRAIKKMFGIAAPPPAVISQSFERAGTAEAAAEELAIDIGALQPGDYVLVVSVVDRVSGETARASRPFVRLFGAVSGINPTRG